MRKVLVTGGKGFIGKHLIRTSNARQMPFSITVFDKDGWTGPVHDQWDGIVHLAALGRLSECEENPVLCMEMNMVLTARILEEKADWFVFASTISPPSSVYGMSKQWCEQLILHEAEKRNMALRILRFASVTGEGENKNKLIPRAVDSIRNGTPFKLSKSTLPVEYVSIRRVVDELIVAMSDAHYSRGSIKAPMRIVDGVIKTEKQLMELAKNVAFADAQPA